jgi:exodeoxyribonuclease III
MALSSATVRVATWNVNSLKARMPRVEEWLANAQPDVLCLQETKLSDTAFPAMTFQGLGYESAHFGQGQWNGVAILSKVGIADVHNGFIDGLVGTGPVDDYVQGVLCEARLITATCGGVRITSVYVPNGRSIDDAHFGAKLEWLTRLREQLALTSSRTDPVIVAGDFNIAPQDRDVWDINKFTNSTHVTPAERERLAALTEWGLVDAFRAKYDSDRLYSYWDYRAGDFHQHRGMRIDLVLATQPIIDSLDWALVDRIARKGKLPSDHAPVVVEFSPPAVA